MIFQLIEEGKLTLSTPLSTFYPQLPNASKITIGMLLQHRSGLHNFTNDAAYREYMAQPKSQHEMVAIFAAMKPDFEPDTRGEYSNTNFALLGYIVEKLTQKSYAENLRERVVTKAGLTDTYYGGKINAANNEANSYTFSNSTWSPASETDMSIPGGAGAVVSTPTDLNKFIEALFAGKLINKAHLGMMQNIRDSYGMAMFHYPVFTYNGYGHTGGIDGFGSQVIHFPTENATIAYCSNGTNYDLVNIILAGVSALFDKPYIIPTFKTVSVGNDVLNKYTGVYSTAAFPLKITVTNNSGTLSAQATGQGAFPLDAQSATIFKYAPAGIMLEFNADKGEMILRQGGGTFTLTKEK
jgi:CubicO group peptidase (beta-lactamase class C family)